MITEITKVVFVEGTVSYDRKDFIQCKMDTPFGPPVNMQERYRLGPGTCVKTMAGGLLEKMCGIVCKHSQDDPRECIVVGHGWSSDPSETFVWRGTMAQFNRTWEGD